MRELLFVCCTPGRKEDTVLFRSLTKFNKFKFLFFEETFNRQSSCYNYALKEFTKTDPILVFVREDVLIGDLYIQEKLNEACDVLGFAVTGVAGATTFNLNENQPATLWHQAPPENLSGFVEYSTRGMQNIVRSFGLAPARCLALDNSLLAVDPRKTAALRFDERFEFHFHELDFCLAAHFAGLLIGTSNVYVNRKPEGMIVNPHYQAAQAVFRAKWRDRFKGAGA